MKHILEEGMTIPNKVPQALWQVFLGAVAQAMRGRDYSPHDPERQIGDDIAAGVVASAGEDPTKRALRSIFEALGPEAGMDFINDTRGGDKPKK